MKKIKIGLIREEKVPHDKRVAFTPAQCKQIFREFPSVELIVQPSDWRSYTNDEYRAAGVSLSENLDDCDILIGIKEVPKDKLIPGKKYLFFSHTIKKQAQNPKILQAIIEKNITLVDYECLVDLSGNRIIGFGRFAGIVG